MLSDALVIINEQHTLLRLNALSSIVCFLTNAEPDSLFALGGLNALSSIVCFLTQGEKWKPYGWAEMGLNALSSIVCFLTLPETIRPDGFSKASQCPLEHCMLSDPRGSGTGNG